MNEVWCIRLGEKEYYAWEMPVSMSITRKRIYNIEGQWMIKELDRLIPIPKIEKELIFDTIGISSITREQQTK